MPSSGGLVFVCLSFLVASSVAFNSDLLELEDSYESDPRLFFANYTSSLISINSTILLYAVGAAAIVGAVALALYFLATSPAPSAYGSYQQQYQARGFRDNSGYDILHFLAVATDIYSKLNKDDVDCQKKIICEFMDEPEMFGAGASKVKSGVQVATSWLKPFGFSIVDEISKATTVDAQDSRTCEERFEECNKISLKETVEEKAAAVNDVKKDLVSEPEEIEDEEVAEEEEEEEEYEYYYEDDTGSRK